MNLSNAEDTQTAYLKISLYFNMTYLYIQRPALERFLSSWILSRSHILLPSECLLGFPNILTLFAIDKTSKSC